MVASSLRSFAAAVLLLASAGCNGDDTSVGGTTPSVDSGAKGDAHADATADGAADATDTGSTSPVLTGFDAAGYDAAGFDSGEALGCSVTGGTVTTLSCCVQEGSFPDTCAAGACSCSPAFSTPTTVCQCPPGTCWGRKVGECIAWDGGGLTPP